VSSSEPTLGAGSRFDVLALRFWRHRRRAGLARATLDNTRRHLARLGAFLARRKVVDVHRVTPAHLTAFASKLRKTRSAKPGEQRLLTITTQVACLVLVRKFFAYLERCGVIMRSPARQIPIPRQFRLPKPSLTETEVARLVEQPLKTTALGKRDRALLELLYGAGLRAGECCRLDERDVSRREETLLVRDGKGRKDRVIPLVGRAASALSTYLDEVRPDLVSSMREPALFLSCRQRRLVLSGVEDIVDRHARAAGLGHTSPHALRHACATHLLRGGASVRYVQKILGHASINTTMIYTQVNTRDLARVLRRAHPRERRRR
jgi:integrase/recombinase XerD